GDERPAGEALQPRRPFDRGEAGGDGGGGEREAGVAERGDRGTGIDVLVAAGKARRRQVEEAVLVLVDEAAALGMRRPVAPAEEDRSALAGGLVLDHVDDRGRLRRHHHRTAGLDDAGLLARDRLDGRAEELLVVHRDRGDHRGERVLDDVGGVEAAAEPDLEERVVGGVIGKQDEGRRGGDLELRNRGAAIGALGFEQRIDQGILVDEMPAALGAEADAFVEGDEVRRGVDVDALPRRFEHSAQERGGRALAVGAGDVDDRRQALFGGAEPVHQHAHAVEREVDLARIKRAEALEDGARPVHGKFRLGQASAATAAAAGSGGTEAAPLPASRRQRRAIVSRSLWRGSTMPCSCRNSARWNFSGSFSRIVCSMTRGPAKPMSAPGSAIWTSPSMAYDAVTPPVVGLVRTTM